MKPLLFVLCVGATASAGCAGHASATATVTTSSTEVYQEPPAPQAEAIIERKGYFWVAGRWEWRANQWSWLGGRWEKERETEAWERGHWDKRGNAWHWTEGHWVPRAAE